MRRRSFLACLRGIESRQSSIRPELGLREHHSGRENGSHRRSMDTYLMAQQRMLLLPAKYFELVVELGLRTR